MPEVTVINNVTTVDVCFGTTNDSKAVITLGKQNTIYVVEEDKFTCHQRLIRQLYVYDTRDELRNRMHHFGGLDESAFNPEIVKGLIHVLDEHNGLVRLFRTARDRYNTGLYEAVSKGDREGIAVGLKIMLSNTFTGGPRVFEQKVKDFFRFLKEVKTFGYVSTVLYAIEFQKRGLSHCHTLLWIELRNTLKDAAKIDEYIFAEITDPVQDPKGYKLVTELMMHSPCGSANLDASCMKNEPCNKHFSKQYNEQTYFDSNSHTQYRRRDTGIHVMKGESRLENCNVVLYNRALCLAFEAHINDTMAGDEAPMNDKSCFEALDKTLRDLMDAPNVLFGGKTIVLRGDFRQTICTLKENMWLQKFGLTSEEHKRSETFAKWLLDVGDGNIWKPEKEDQDSSWITILPKYSVDNDETSLSNLIHVIYDDTTLKTPTAGSSKKKQLCVQRMPLQTM
nr:DNA helicase [Tanacetum cinerariifolium]